MMDMEATGERNPDYKPRRLRWDYVTIRGLPTGSLARTTYDADGVLEIRVFAPDEALRETIDPAAGDQIIPEGHAFVAQHKERIDPEKAARLLYEQFRQEAHPVGMVSIPWD